MPIYVQLEHVTEELSRKYKHIFQENTTLLLLQSWQDQ